MCFCPNLEMYLAMSSWMGAYTSTWWFHWKIQINQLHFLVHSNNHLRVRQKRSLDAKFWPFELFISTLAHFWCHKVILKPIELLLKTNAGRSEICIYAGDGSTTRAIFSSWLLHQTVHWSHPVSPNGSFICWGSTASNGSKQIQCIHLSSWAI